MTKYKKSLPFYHTAAWKKVRALALARDNGMCRDCMERFRSGLSARPRRAAMVHHVVPYDERPDLALNLDNLVSLCDVCHNRRHPEKGQQKEYPEKNIPKMRVIRA